MTLSKSTRAELRRRCPTPEETDALLDMADELDAKDEEIGSLIDAQADTREELEKAEHERDRYRTLLVEARGMIDLVGWTTGSEIDKTCERIDAALEGKE